MLAGKIEGTFCGRPHKQGLPLFQWEEESPTHPSPVIFFVLFFKLLILCHFGVVSPSSFFHCQGSFSLQSPAVQEEDFGIRREGQSKKGNLTCFLRGRERERLAGAMEIRAEKWEMSGQ